MFDMVSKVLSALFSRKSEDFKNAYQSCANDYYQNTDIGSYNIAWLKKLTWAALVSGGFLVQTVVGLPLGVMVTVGTIFLASMLMTVFAIIRKYQGYNAFVEKNKQAIAVIDKVRHLESSVQLLINRVQALAATENPDGRGPRYTALKKILSHLEKNKVVLSGDLMVDAKLAKHTYQIIWDVVRMTTLTAEGGHNKMREWIPKDHPHKEEIVRILDKIPENKQVLLVEGFFSTDEQACFDSGLSYEDLVSLEKLMTQRDEGMVNEVKDFWAQVFLGQETLPLDVVILEKNMQELTQQALEQFFEGESLGAKEERIVADVQAEILLSELDKISRQLQKKTVELGQTTEKTQEQQIHFLYFTELWLACQDMMGSLSNPSGMGLEELKATQEGLTQLRQQVAEETPPPGYWEAQNQKEQFSKIKNTLRTYVSTLPDKKMPANMQKVTEVLQEAAQAKNGKACQEIISKTYCYDPFVLDKKMVSSKLADKYLTRINQSWELFCLSMQQSNIFSPQWAESCLTTIESFHRVYDTMKENEVMFAGRVLMRNKPKIKEGMAKIDGLLRSIEIHNIKHTSDVHSVDAQELMNRAYQNVLRNEPNTQPESRMKSIFSYKNTRH
jgi:hypothetical protein